MFVCSRHFHTGKPEMLECHPDWVPSLHLGHTEVKTTHTHSVLPGGRRDSKLYRGHRWMKLHLQMKLHRFYKWMTLHQRITENSRNAVFVATGVLKLTTCWRRTGY
ncbi:hypothetical protein R3I93_016302 [Phoxinus phoxinus]|uniref:THAP-type domain-containing protein n=1 Tax=Phoxinus phoxinus TaxID=58324 RepID=A0AAN9CJ94_9TELE